MRVGSDRVQFAAVTTVAVVGWVVVMFTVPSPPPPYPEGPLLALSAATMLRIVWAAVRVPFFAMTVAAGSFVVAWVVLDWRRPPRRPVTISLVVLCVLVVATPFLSQSY